MRIFFFSLFLASTLFAADADSQRLLQERYRQLDSEPPALLEGLDASERKALFDETLQHPIAAPSKVKDYDKKGDVGFCFGRAMTSHLLARKRGLAPRSIRKLFIVGDLRSGETPEWRFHVTTLVKGEDGLWYAIDPTMRPPFAERAPLLAAAWIKVVKGRWDKANRAHLYLTGREAILPDMTTLPTTEMETGERLMELRFEPQAHAGFTAVPFEDTTVYALDADAQEAYFTQVFERTVEGELDFSRLEMKVLKKDGPAQRLFEFNGYFHDLLKYLSLPDLPEDVFAPEGRAAAPGFRSSFLH